MLVTDPGPNPRKFYVRYWDAKGNLMGPYSFDYNPVQGEATRYIKDMADDLKMSMPGELPRTKKEAGKTYIDLGHIYKLDENYRQGGPSLLKSFSYSVDFDALDKTCNPAPPVSTIPIPEGTKQVFLQITYSDGSQSPVYGSRVQ